MTLRRAILAISMALCGLAVWAQSAPKPWVLVVPAQNRTGNAALDPIGTNVADTITLTLRFLGEFDVREVPVDQIPDAVVAGDPAALREFAEDQTMDYVVFGSVSIQDDAFDIEAAVWDRGADSVSVREAGTSPSLLDTFDVAEDLAGQFLSAFSGQRIAFGEIRLRREGWSGGEYRVLIDGTEAARNRPVVSNVLIGEREIVVEALTGPQAGEALLDEFVTVTEGGVSRLTFAMEEPVIVEADPPVDETPADPPVPGEEIAAEPAPEPSEPTAPENDPAEVARVAEPEPEPSDAGGGPWTRSARTSPDRRPIYSVGLAYRPTILRPFDDPTTLVTSVFGGPGPTSLWFAVDWPRGFHFASSVSGSLVAAAGSVDGQNQDDADIEAVILSREFESLHFGRLDLQVDAGQRVLARPLGSWDMDVVALGFVGLALQFTEYVSTTDLGTISDGETLLEVEGGTGDAWWLGRFGAAAEARFHFRRLTVRSRLDLAWEGTIADEGTALVIREEIETGVTPLDRYGNGMTTSFFLGLGYSWGGRR